MARTSVPISEETRERLCKVKGKMMVANGKEHSVEDVINKLIEFYEENHK